MKRAEVTVRVTEMEALRSFLERVRDFINEYAWHDRNCAAIDADGEWRRGNPPCDCGYDEALAAIQKGMDS